MVAGERACQRGLRCSRWFHLAKLLTTQIELSARLKNDSRPWHEPFPEARIIAVTGVRAARLEILRAPSARCVHPSGCSISSGLARARRAREMACWKRTNSTHTVLALYQLSHERALRDRQEPEPAARVEEELIGVRLERRDDDLGIGQ
jgi:hypothetical protein